MFGYGCMCAPSFSFPLPFQAQTAETSQYRPIGHMSQHGYTHEFIECLRMKPARIDRQHQSFQHQSPKDTCPPTSWCKKNAISNSEHQPIGIVIENTDNCGNTMWYPCPCNCVAKDREY